MVVSAVEFHFTVDPLTKFVPVTVRAKGAPPAAAEVELNDTMVGPLTVNELAADEAVLEFCTVTFGDPAAASCVLVTAAVSEVAPP